MGWGMRYGARSPRETWRVMLDWERRLWEPRDWRKRKSREVKEQRQSTRESLVADQERGRVIHNHRTPVPEVVLEEALGEVGAGSQLLSVSEYPTTQIAPKEPIVRFHRGNPSIWVQPISREFPFLCCRKRPVPLHSVVGTFALGPG